MKENFNKLYIKKYVRMHKTLKRTTENYSRKTEEEKNEVN